MLRVEHLSIQFDKGGKPGMEKKIVFTILVTWDKIIFHHKFSIPKRFFLKKYWKYEQYPLKKTMQI